MEKNKNLVQKVVTLNEGTNKGNIKPQSNIDKSKILPPPPPKPKSH
jgi:hypothetical protein